jgi:hypothetical protein
MEAMNLRGMVAETLKEEGLGFHIIIMDLILMVVVIYFHRGAKLKLLLLKVVLHRLNHFILE